MNKTVFLLVLANVAMTSVGQILLKGGMSAPSVTRSLEDGLRLSSALVILLNPLVAIGLALYFLAAGVWLLVLARIEVSLAYPFVGLGFIVTMVLGWAVFDDTMSVARVGGTLMIAGGVALLATS
jgi:multidrug transporter EmrE-like cation transporter